MRLLYVIATYNRAEMLERLLDQIHAISPFPFSILIYDDGSNESYKKPLQKIRSQDVFIQARKNLGRKGYQEVTNTLFNLAETFEFDYLIKLDDDVELRQDSIEKAMDLIPFRPSEKELKEYRGMSDIWFAVKANMNRIGIYAVPRSAGWMKDTDESKSLDTLYREYSKDTSKHCKILNKLEWL